MLGLRPFAQQQDENALAGLHRPAALKGGAGGAGGEGGLGARKGAPTPGFPRKALGNITNNTGGRGLDAENAPPGKTPAGGAPAPARRVLGDITNAGGALGAAQRPSGLKPQQAAQQPACVAAAADAPAARADALAEGGVERVYGRGWEALEAARLAREDEESLRRLAALAGFPGCAPSLPNFSPLWGAPAGASQQQALQKDALPPLPASPVAKRQPSFAAGGALAPLDPPAADLALPDLPCPSLDDELPGLPGHDLFD